MNIQDKLFNLYINLFPNAIVDPKDISFTALVDLVITELLRRHNEEKLANGIMEVNNEKI